MEQQIDRALAQKVLRVVDAGLSHGLGKPQPGMMCVEAAVNYAMGKPHGDNPDCVAPALRSLKIKLNDMAWSSKEARAKGLRRLAIAQLGSAGALNQTEFARRVAEMAIKISVSRALLAAARIQKDEKHKLALTEAAKRCQKEGTRRAALDAKVAANAAAYAAANAAANAAAYATANAAANAAAYGAAYAAADAAAYAAYAYAADAAAYAADAYAADAADAAAKVRDQKLSGFAEAVVQILTEMKAPGCAFLDLTEAV